MLVGDNFFFTSPSPREISELPVSPQTCQMTCKSLIHQRPTICNKFWCWTPFHSAWEEPRLESNWKFLVTKNKRQKAYCQSQIPFRNILLPMDQIKQLRDPFLTLRSPRAEQQGNLLSNSKTMKSNFIVLSNQVILVTIFPTVQPFMKANNCDWK